MIKHFSIAASLLALAMTAAPASEARRSATQPTIVQASEDKTIFLKCLPGAASLRETSGEQALLTCIDAWLSANFELPRAERLPNVEYAPIAKIAALRYKGLTVASSDVTGSSVQTALERSTVAIYVDAERTIYLSDEWMGSTPAELSVLAHEMVHHMQNLSGRRYECIRAREKVAFAAQEKFLQLFGSDLAKEFELDPFTILVRSTCAY